MLQTVKALCLTRQLSMQSMKYLILSTATLLLSAAPSVAQDVRAYVFDPPSNVRATPNGTIQCSVKQTQYVNVLGTSSDGAWYLTDYCGSTGYIHNSQVVQPEVNRSTQPYTSGYCILRGQVVADYHCY